MKLACIRLLTDDFPAAYAFWHEVMGFPVTYTMPGYAYFTLGETGLELFARDGFAAALGNEVAISAPTGQQAVVVLQVEDVDATYAAVVARGATPIAAPVDRPAWGARTAHLVDSDGHLIELYRRLA